MRFSQKFRPPLPIPRFSLFISVQCSSVPRLRDLWLKVFPCLSEISNLRFQIALSPEPETCHLTRFLSVLGASAVSFFPIISLHLSVFICVHLWLKGFGLSS